MWQRRQMLGTENSEFQDINPAGIVIKMERKRLVFCFQSKQAKQQRLLSKLQHYKGAMMQRHKWCSEGHKGIRQMCFLAQDFKAFKKDSNVSSSEDKQPKDTCICMTESLCSPPETIMTLLIDYTLIQNKKV